MYSPDMFGRKGKYWLDQFPALFEESMKHREGKGVFKICDDGYARLIIVTKEGKCLLFKEEIK